ncbi:PAS domain S-box protein [Mucilaginibacter sp. BT774]|uniref:PAS domain S-box protein n=1 Tax=Mucilaginibacter sp. BT774 TaxID=3062276 RepID=UPI002674EFB0|nr:PAS domain S-box protein [Mucilaginibacter sp. BT774]MDO3627621.1 PAS domain S-box protein [Mucilaginibacter sp. BT774]
MSAITSQTHIFQSEVKERSDKLMNFFLACHFLIGLALASFYGTWLIAIGVGSISLIAYYSAKIALPDSNLYQYVLSVVLGIFMAQFIYQMHGMFEMHFFAFIGSALLITYQQWKLQIPLTLVVVVHHGLLGYLQDIGYSQVYFTQLNYFDVQTFVIHVILAAIVFFVCGLWAFQLRKYNERQIIQTMKMGELEKEAELSVERAKIADALEERNTILESITDAFFAVDHNWLVLYWNAMAEKELGVARHKVLNQHLWKVFVGSIDSESYRQYQLAMKTRQVVHFHDFYPVLEKWYDISAYPSANGLSVYFKDVTDRKLSEIRLTESEKRYSELFHLSPQPMWVFEIETMQFLDVNEAAVRHYGYSRPEFLDMTIRDIRPPDEVPVVEQIVSRGKTEKQIHHEQVFKHRTKDGKVIYVDIQSTAIMYNGSPSKVVLANDITERLNYINAVEAQNKKLKEIAWLQSHVIRAPLAKIKGLIPLMKDGKETIIEKEKMLDYLLRSADELDEVINSITDKSNLVEVQSPL